MQIVRGIMEEKHSSDVFKFVDQAKPNYYKLLQLALTLPVSSVKCKRTISVLRRVHNYMRTTMSDSRLTELSLLAIEKDIL